MTVSHIKSLKTQSTLTLEFDSTNIRAKNTKPNSPESRAIADALYTKIKNTDILPTSFAVMESLAFIASQASDEAAREDAGQRLVVSLSRVAGQDRKTAISMAQSLQTSLLCDQAVRGDLLIFLVDTVDNDATTLKNIAGNAGDLNQQQRLKLLVKIAESLIEQPYEMVMALREFCDAADWTRCPIASKAYDICYEYSQSPSYIAEVLEREFDVTIQSVSKPANNTPSHLKVIK